MKWALVTGAAKRIGKSIASRLAEHGYGVLVHYHNSAEQALQTVEKIRQDGHEAFPVCADLLVPEGPEVLFDSAIQHAGHIDVLVNSAGAYRRGSTCDVSGEDFIELYALHALAPFQLCRRLAAQGRAAVAVTLLDCRIGDFAFDRVAYLNSKQSAWELMRLLAVELAPQVRVNAVAPGLILPPQDEPGALDGLEGSNPLLRFGRVEEVTDAVMYLIQAEYTTGQIIYVDGGRHLGPRLGAARMRRNEMETS